VRGSSQALLARLLTGCGIEAFGDVQARAVGALAARAATDIVDACVVEGAMRRHDLGVSSDEGDLQAIAGATDVVRAVTLRARFGRERLRGLVMDESR
jgi:CBS domain-containing protein